MIFVGNANSYAFSSLALFASCRCVRAMCRRHMAGSSLGMSASDMDFFVMHDRLRIAVWLARSVPLAGTVAIRPTVLRTHLARPCRG